MSEVIVIERGIPLPPCNRGRPSGQRVWPLETMRPGESFAIPGKRVKAVRAAAQNAKRRTGWKFTVRKMQDGSYRAFRVA